MKTLFLTVALFLAFTGMAGAQSITSPLSLGSRGDQVRILQSFLARDANIYPEGLVTGYFGLLTKAAVTRLQRANGLPQVGVVGPLTRALLASRMQAQTSLVVAGPPNIPPISQPIPPTPVPQIGTVCNTALIGPDGLDSSRVISKEACDLLNTLYAQGKAAGNSSDTYENRDGLHVNLCDGWTPNPECPAANRLFPQHQWQLSGGAGRATGVRPGITVGQASYAGETSGSVKHSIAYAIYKTQAGADALYEQYTRNNLYIYPSLIESTDDNIANTPYVISSEDYGKDGSNYYRHDASGSDLPFVKIAMAGLAAFKPDVKRALTNSQLLMPTLQMAIRHAHRSINSESDYLGSIAHENTERAHYLLNGLPQPNYDSAKLVRLANELTAADIPPLVRLRIASEDFTGDERLFTTPAAIARSVQSGTASRTIKVSAEAIDITGSTAGYVFEWRVLNSDASTVAMTIDPADPTTATIRFLVQEARQRIDIGVFAKKPSGKYYSAPSFITVYGR